MLYSEVKTIYDDLQAFQRLRANHNGFRKEKVEIVVTLKGTDESIKFSLKPHKIFDFDTYANDVASITAFSHADGQPLQEWLKDATIKFYETIDDVVNGWLDRLRTIKGLEAIYEHPQYGFKKITKRHCLWFPGERRTDFDIGYGRLDLEPFSFKRYSTGYGHEGNGLTLPRTEDFSLLVPTEEEEVVMQKYDIKYELLQSVEVTRYELQTFTREREEMYDDSDSDSD